ncbi:magnesium/cobalt transporter CorA [bacterium]|nr:magnesium/cobalt transporter CorA [bacterium]
MKNILKETANQTFSTASNVVESITRAIGSTLSLPGLTARKSAGSTKPTPGSAPGIESMADLNQPPAPGTIRIRCVDYSPDRIEKTDVADLDAFLKQTRPEWIKVRWLNVDGLHPWVVNQLREHFHFHTLAAEDVLRVPQRPKLEDYDDNLFIVVRMMMVKDNRLHHEQVSLFFYQDTILTFQETEGDVWDPIRQRLEKPASRLRLQDTSYLLYALLDAVVDHCFPILEKYGDELDRLEEELIDRANPAIQRRIHQIKRELSLLRRIIWPMREVINTLQREENEDITPFAKAYMRDVYDHTIQVMDVVETYREMVGGLNDLYMSVVSNRMNEIMKVLTIMASFFIPITFVAGVYGMNFEFIPELHWKYSYAVFWAVCLSIIGGLAIFFYRRGWIGRG